MQKTYIIRGIECKYKLKDLLDCFTVSKSTYYYNLNKNNNKDGFIEEEILKIFNNNKARYGYRRICIALKNKGLIVNHKKVLRIMRKLNLKPRYKNKKKYNSYKGEIGKVAPNIINRDFKTDKPFNKLFTDVTEFKINDAKIYLSPIIDSYNGEVVAYDISTSPNMKQIYNMLDMLYKVLPKDLEYETYLHSDQGWQYQHKGYQENLKEHGITQSMSRKATCLDNAIGEGFFGKLKNEFYYQEKFNSVQEFIIKLEEYIEYYNKKRIKTALRCSPYDYRVRNAA